MAIKAQPGNTSPCLPKFNEAQGQDCIPCVAIAFSFPNSLATTYSDISIPAEIPADRIIQLSDSSTGTEALSGIKDRSLPAKTGLNVANIRLMLRVERK